MTLRPSSRILCPNFSLCSSGIKNGPVINNKTSGNDHRNQNAFQNKFFLYTIIRLPSVQQSEQINNLLHLHAARSLEQDCVARLQDLMQFRSRFLMRAAGLNHRHPTRPGASGNKIAHHATRDHRGKLVLSQFLANPAMPIPIRCPTQAYLPLLQFCGLWSNQTAY